MNNYFYAQSGSSVREIMHKVFGWMGVALALTGVAAYIVTAYQPLQIAIFSNPALIFVLMLAQLGAVIVLQFGLLRMSLPTAMALFVAYSLLTGITLSSIFLVYTTASIVATFFVAAGMFISMAIYGAVTKADLSSIGSLMLMMLWGIILAMIVNLFLRSAMLDLVLAILGVVVFSLLTAFDIQNIKHILGQLSGEVAEKVAIIGALQLYLDFINLFLSLLRIMGRRRD